MKLFFILSIIISALLSTVKVQAKEMVSVATMKSAVAHNSSWNSSARNDINMNRLKNTRAALAYIAKAYHCEGNTSSVKVKELTFTMDFDIDFSAFNCYDLIIETKDNYIIRYLTRVDVVNFPVVIQQADRRGGERLEVSLEFEDGFVVNKSFLIDQENLLIEQ
jgi:hypothetical protein